MATNGQAALFDSGEAPARRRKASAPRKRKAAEAPPAAPRKGRDALLAAVLEMIPDGAEWSAEDRLGWLRLFISAADVAFGVVEPIRVELGAREVELLAIARQGVAIASAAAPREASPQPSSGGPTVFKITRDGFVLRNEQQIDMHEVPLDTAFLDFREGDEFGDPAGMMWKTGGYSDRPLPRGCTFLRPARREGLPEGGVSG